MMICKNRNAYQSVAKEVKLRAALDFLCRLWYNKGMYFKRLN